MATINGLVLRRILGKSKYLAPIEFGDDGWMLMQADGDGAVIVTASEFEDVAGDVSTWIHASISHVTSTPTYEELKLLHRAAFSDGYAYQVFAMEDDHINIHSNALHLWGRFDGERALPDFGELGSI